MKKMRVFINWLSTKLPIIVKIHIPLLVFIGGIIAFYINFSIDAPVFDQPKYMYVNRETFMEYLEKDDIYYLPGIYECITNESNDWIKRSLIELVEIKLASGIASDTSVEFNVYNSSGYTEEGFCFLLTITPNAPTSSENIKLKTFEEGRTIYIPLSITAPLYDSASGNKIFSSEELNSMDKVLIQYRPRYIKYKNGKWQRVPIFKNKHYKTEFKGMQISKPIMEKKGSDN